MPNTVENFAAKAAGKAAGLRARAQGLVGVFNVLAQQHEQAASLLTRAKQANDPAKRRELWSQVRCELICHERAELGTVYPVFEENPASADMARAHADSARDLEAAIANVDALGYDSDSWEGSLQSLIQLVQQHVEQEEQEFFPRAQDTIGKDAAHGLERPLLAAQEQCRTQMSQLG
jgi:hemerythrin HHE cation binding domain-containing protein